jgi:hypothetical protein
MGMVERLDLGNRSGWRLALPEVGCMGDDLLGNDCSIGGYPEGAGEDQDAEAENVAQGHRSEDPGAKPPPSEFDREHF